MSLQVSSRGESEQRARDLAAAEAEIADLRRQLEAQKQAAASAAADPAPRPAAKRGRKKVNGTAATAVEVEHISASQAADAAVAAAQADAAAAQQRAIEIRAEAAMLVETVEDRAHAVRCFTGGCCRDRQGAGECMQPQQCSTLPTCAALASSHHPDSPAWCWMLGKPSATWQTWPPTAAPQRVQAVMEAEGKAKSAEREVERLRAKLRLLSSRDEA